MRLGFLLVFTRGPDGSYFLQMVQLLLDKGADPKLGDSDGQSAREYAAMSGHTQVFYKPLALQLG